MITLISAIIILLLGYFFYSKVIERLLDIKPNRKTPAYTNSDNVDFVPMSKQTNAMVQLLNIAGTGPIFGPILAALYGPVSLVWIVLGAIFAGGVHDFMIGMISLKNKGATLPTLAEVFLSKKFKHFTNFFSALLLLLVGTVFIIGPAKLLLNIFTFTNLFTIVFIIFVYYFLSTLLPINKIIGKLYPLFGALLIFSTLALLIYLFASDVKIPELTFANLHPQELPIFPLLFLTLSCGALSGFHATQSPMISRTLQNENQGRYVFYGMMIAEAIIALTWATITIAIMDGQTLLQLIETGTPSLVVERVSVLALGSFFSVFAILGVIILPITSGDTAFRGLRLMLAEYLKLPQKSVTNRLYIAVPCFAIAVALCFVDFQILWRYFSFANQALASITLWIITAYCIQNNKAMWYSLIPAFFITTAVVSFLLYSSIGFNINLNASIILSIIITVIITILVIRSSKNILNNRV